jgi:hypothetical protein
MPVRTISKNGVPVSYQAIVGNGGKGNSKSFSVAKLGQVAALSAASLEAIRMEEAYTPPPRKAQRGNAAGVPGLRLEYMRPKGDGVPVLYAIATWSEKGVVCSNKFSTDSNGILPAIELAKKAREAGAGVTISQSAAELEVLMRKAIDASIKKP